MPLTLNVEISKKIGQRDYGSLGASCHVTVELDQGLLQHDLESLHRHVKNAFVACREAVNHELHAHKEPHSAGNAKGCAAGRRGFPASRGRAAWRCRECPPWRSGRLRLGASRRSRRRVDIPPKRPI